MNCTECKLEKHFRNLQGFAVNYHRYMLLCDDCLKKFGVWEDLKQIYKEHAHDDVKKGDIIINKIDEFKRNEMVKR